MTKRKPKPVNLLDRDGVSYGTATVETINRLVSKGLIEKRRSPVGHDYWARTELGDAVVAYASGGKLH